MIDCVSMRNSRIDEQQHRAGLGHRTTFSTLTPNRECAPGSGSSTRCPCCSSGLRRSAPRALVMYRQAGSWSGCCDAHSSLPGSRRILKMRSSSLNALASGAPKTQWRPSGLRRAHTPGAIWGLVREGVQAPLSLAPPWPGRSWLRELRLSACPYPWVPKSIQPAAPLARLATASLRTSWSPGSRAGTTPDGRGAWPIEPKGSSSSSS
jgi:hypothetical protein